MPVAPRPVRHRDRQKGTQQTWMWRNELGFRTNRRECFIGFTEGEKIHRFCRCSRKREEEAWSTWKRFYNFNRIEESD